MELWRKNMIKTALGKITANATYSLQSDDNADYSSLIISEAKDIIRECEFILSLANGTSIFDKNMASKNQNP